MSALDELWNLLEHQPISEGVLADWHNRLGPSFEVTQSHFLQRTEKLSATYPCDNPNNDGCPRKVVTHAQDDIVAVCGNSPPLCETIKLKREELVVYELKLDSVARHVAKACEFDGKSGDFVEGLDGVFSLGTFTPSKGSRTPAYLIIPDLRDDYDVFFRHIVAIHKKENPLLIVPTGERITSADQRLLDSRVLGPIACRDFLVWDLSRKLVTTTGVEKAIAGTIAATEITQDDLPPKAACFTHDSKDVVMIGSDDEITALRKRNANADHFVDAMAPNRPVKKKEGKKFESSSLTPAEMSMLIAYLLRFQHKDEPIVPSQIRLDNPSTASGRSQAFKTLRSKIDTDGAIKKQKRLFKSHPAIEGKAYRYEFNPDQNTRYCFIFPVDAFRNVRQQMKK